ncbi:peptidoglycan DD-metalloendopeptidase family protein [Burkholderia sp. FERM BP-3421]|uniref:peptidoglycan DD-metalloendopeptidase family protein n=1 Tax=Burkholderia sp. FERM BP-3421 TaxID=1494466 RepID=UPI0023614131|nr:peptidoglycan DD-metalloendopeptidase family protein [Burkholderia sp. FERM BP-3421]WDD92035.1 peptidoglycan DD-metalloendopeptidase family protein [Burkholderia sp. FERM BP-3421]
MKKGGMTKRAAWLPGMAVAFVLAGCAGPQTTTPPDEASASAAQPASAAAPDAASAAGVAAAAKPAPIRYVIKRGDTLTTIAKANNCSVQDLRAWNRLGRRSRLAAGQVLRIVPRVQVQQTAQATPAAAPTTTPAPVERGAARRIAQDATRHAQRVALAWPAQGSVIEGFTPGRNRGIQISGRPGDPIRAAAAGRVMYAGVGLNGYGTLILVQHNADFLTAYAHSRKLLVKTGDVVRQGDAIAEMGDVDNGQVAVLFEVRRDGRPVDPMPYLPGKQSQS